MNPSASPSTGERYDSLGKAYDSLKRSYKTLLDNKNVILKDLIRVKSDLVNALTNDSTNKTKIKELLEKQKTQG